METRENLELIRKAKAGNEEAVEKIIKKHIKIVYKINSSYGKSEDGVQEGILAILKALETFDEKYEVKFSTHSYRYILKHIKENYYKEKHGTTVYYSNKIRAGEIDYNGQLEFFGEILGEDISQDLETKILIRNLIKMNCNNKEKEFIKKFFFEGKTVAEIACEVNLTRQAVHHFKNKILHKLRRGLNGRN